jgi:hypothetical protein
VQVIPAGDYDFALGESLEIFDAQQLRIKSAGYPECAIVVCGKFTMILSDPGSVA